MLDVLEKTETLKLEFIAAGVECATYAIKQNNEPTLFPCDTGKKVLKLYQSEKAARRVFGRAKTAAENNIGPEVYGETVYREMVCNGRVYAYGYVTQCVETLGGSEYNDYFSLCGFPHVNVTSFMGQDEVAFLEKYVDLGDMLTDVFGYWQDLHRYNLGFIGHKLVCIDFGDCSTMQNCSDCIS